MRKMTEHVELAEKLGGSLGRCKQKAKYAVSKDLES